MIDVITLNKKKEWNDFVHGFKDYDSYYTAEYLQPFDETLRSNHWFYSLVTDKRDELIKYLNENNIQTRPIWKLIHTLKPYKDCQSYKIEKALEYYEKIVNIPCSTNLSKQDIDRVVSQITNIKQAQGWK